MARRRRRRRGTWFPNLGTLGPNADPDDDDPGLWGQLAIGGEVNPAATSLAILPLTFDEAREDEELEADTTLADFLGSEYVVERILGTIFVARRTTTAVSRVPAIKVTAGIFVARQEDSTHEAVGEGALPIGTQTASEARENYSPMTNSTIREPWMWRRSWILGNTALQADNSQTVFQNTQSVHNFPPTNVGYLGMMTGPYVDVKSKRHVRQDDRLYFIIAGRNLSDNWTAPFNENDTIEEPVQFHFDYRIFGRLVKAAQRSAF